jgi:hypothetical protein
MDILSSQICPHGRILGKNLSMGKGRPPSGFEELTERPGFRASTAQREWLERARKAAGAMSLGEWLRIVAVQAGEKLLKEKWPARAMIPEDEPAQTTGHTGAKRRRR